MTVTAVEPGPARRLSLALALAVLVVGGCTDGLAFRQDDRLRMTAPKDRSTVTLPLTVAWADAGIGPARWAVLVDRNPPPHGQALAWLGEDQRGVTETTRQALTLEIIPTRTEAAPSERTTHEVIIVPLDARGRRIGESFAKVQFTVEIPS